MKKIRLSRIIIYLFLILMFLISVFPFYWMIVGMTNSAVDVIKGKMTFGNQFFHNAKVLFSNYDVKRIFFN